MEASEYYHRQTMLKEVGSEGQGKLTATKAIIVGAGGLGHPVASYLAAAGIGEIVIVDFDVVEESNLNRQVCFSPEDIGRFKAQVLAERISRQNPFIKVEFKVQRVDQKGIEPCDLVLDCCDHLATKYLLHDLAWRSKTNLVQAAIYQYEGQMQIFPFAKSSDQGCWRCLWKSVPPPHCAGDCNSAGVMGAAVGSLGALQANAAINLVLGIGDSAPNQTLTLNLKTTEWQKLSWRKNADCPLCSGRKNIQEDSFEKTDITGDHQLIDIRELGETEHQSLLSDYQVRRLPCSQLEEWQDSLDPNESYLFFCARGIRSSLLVSSLRPRYPNCYSLAGGLESLLTP